MADASPPLASSANIGRGIALVLLANLLFSLVDTSTKWLIGGGLAVIQLAFMRYASHFAITCVERLARGRLPKPLDARLRGYALLRSFCLVSATVVNFFALGQLPLSVTSAMLFLAPIFVCFFARPILHEQIKPLHWLAVALGFVGVLLILWPFGQPVNWYAVMMVYPAAAMALYQVLTRKLTRQITPATLQFYTGAMGTAALLPFAWFAWVPPADGLSLVLLFAIGAFAWAGHEALTRAHAYAQASILAPFGYSFVVFLIVAGLVVFGEVPTANVLFGAIVIFVSGTFAWRGAR